MKIKLLINMLFIRSIPSIKSHYSIILFFFFFLFYLFILFFCFLGWNLFIIYMFESWENIVHKKMFFIEFSRIQQNTKKCFLDYFKNATKCLKILNLQLKNIFKWNKNATWMKFFLFFYFLCLWLIQKNISQTINHKNHNTILF